MLDIFIKYWYDYTKTLKIFIFLSPKHKIKYEKT